MERNEGKISVCIKKVLLCTWAFGLAVLCEIDQWKTSPGLLLTFDIIL